MITAIATLSALLLAAIAAALGYRSSARSKQRQIESLSGQAARHLAERDEAIRLMHAAVTDGHRIAREAREAVDAERAAADERVAAEAAAAKSAAGINARAQAGDLGALRDALDDLEAQR